MEPDFVISFFNFDSVCKKLEKKVGTQNNHPEEDGSVSFILKKCFV